MKTIRQALKGKTLCENHPPGCEVGAGRWGRGLGQGALALYCPFRKQCSVRLPRWERGVRSRSAPFAGGHSEPGLGPPLTPDANTVYLRQSNEKARNRMWLFFKSFLGKGSPRCPPTPLLWTPALRASVWGLGSRMTAALGTARGAAALGAQPRGHTDRSYVQNRSERGVPDDSAWEAPLGAVRRGGWSSVRSMGVRACVWTWAERPCVDL